MRSLLAAVLLAAPAAAAPPARVYVPRLDGNGRPVPFGAALRLGSGRFQNGFFVTALAFSRDGKTLVTAGTGGVRAWDAATGRLRWAALSHGTQATRGPIGFRPDGASVWVARSADTFGGTGTDKVGGLVRYDLATGRLVERADVAVNFTSGGNAVAFSADGTRAVWQTEDNAVEVRDLVTGRAVRTVPHPAENANLTDIHLSRAGATAVAVFNGTLYTLATADGTYRKIDTAVDMEAADVSPDGTRVACLTGVNANGQAVLVRVYDAATGKPVGEPISVPHAARHVYWTSVTFSPDGKTLAVSGMGFDLFLFDAATGKLVRRLPGHGGCRQPAFRPDGKTIAAGMFGTMLWDTATGAKLPQSADLAGCGFGGDISFADTALTVAGGSDDGAVTWDLLTGRETARLTPAAAAARGLIARTVSYNTRPLTARSADGRRVAVPADDAPAGVAVRDAATGKEVSRVPDLGGYTDLHLSADGRFLLAGTTGTGGRPVAVYDADTGKRRHELKPAAGATNILSVGLSNVAPCPDGVHAAVIDGCQFAGGNTDSVTFNVGLYDATTGRETGRLTGAGLPYRLAWSADGATLVGVGVKDFSRGDTGFAFAADRRTGKFVAAPFDTGGSPTLGAASADGTELVTAGADGVRVWEATTGKRRFTLPTGPLTWGSVGFSPDGRWLVAAGGDQGVTAWDLRALRPTPGLTAAGLDAAWADLNSPDATVAYRAARRLAGSPAVAAPFLAGKIAPVPPPDPDKLAKWLADLDSPRFADRDAATRELRKLNELAVPAVRAALAATTSAEVRQRCEDILARAASPAPGPDQLRADRAVEAVGWMDAPDGRALLARWAAGADGHRLTRRAKAAVGR